MIQYTRCAADTKNRIKELALASGGFFLILAACALVVAVVFFVAGAIAQNTVVSSFGMRALIFVFVLVGIYFVVYSNIRKAVKANFESLEVDGKIDYTLETTEDGKLRFTRLTDEEFFEINYADIKKIKHVKTITVIFLKNGKTVDIPIDVDLAGLINNA